MHNSNRSILQRSIYLLLVVLFLPAASARAQSQATPQELERIVGDARYVNFGEDSHFMKGVHRYVADSFRHLAENKNFRVFVFESAWGIEDHFKDFMNSDRTIVTAEEQFFLNAFSSKAIVEMLVWIREWNRKNPNDKIRIAGYQPEQPVTDFNFLWDFAGKSPKFAAADLRAKAAVCRAGSGEFNTNIEFISATSKRRRSGQPTYTAEERASCNQAIDAIENFIEQNKKELIGKNSRNDYAEAGAHLKSLRTYLNTLTAALDYTVINKKPTPEEQKAQTGKVYEEGDKTRFEIFEILRETRYKNLKVFFWMHNWHAVKDSGEVGAVGKTEIESSLPGGTISIGTRMAQKYGKSLVVIGNIVPKVVCKNPICVPLPARGDSLESKFAAHFGAGSALVNLRKPIDANNQLPLGVPGSLYADLHQGHFTNVVLNRQFDAIYYLPETTATFEDK